MAQRDVVGAALGREAVAVAIIVYRIERVAHGDTIDRHVVCGVGDVDADREIVAVLELAVSAHILDQHLVAVVLDAERALRLSAPRDDPDRQPDAARPGVGDRGLIVAAARTHLYPD